MKYLGIVIHSARLCKLSLHEHKAVFFIAVNCILYEVKGLSDDMDVMHLNDLLSPTVNQYACLCIDFSSSEVAQLSHAWNCVFLRGGEFLMLELQT